VFSQRVSHCTNVLWFDLERITLACPGQGGNLGGMRAYAQDLRARIIRALERQEETQAEIADRFTVSLAFVEKLRRRWRRTGKVEALPQAGGRRRKWQAGEERRRAEVREGPDMTLGTLGERGGTQGRAGQSQDDVGRAATIAVTAQKKSLHASERETPGGKRLRAEFDARRVNFVLAQLKFWDETGSNLALTPRYGRAASGERVVDPVPQNSGENLSFLAVLSLNGLSAPRRVEGAVDTAVFHAYGEQVLSPTLQPGDSVVMDNLAVHNVAELAQLITARGGAHRISAPVFSRSESQ
jgi:hypothetical protein